jgi:D-alanyl-lipoteichoic acid acyltransferase DltB (MBOAT superfamily)
LLGARLAPWSLDLPMLSDVLAKPGNPGIAMGWLGIYLELVRATTRLAVFGHVIVGSLRLLGFNVFRNTYKPLFATSIVEFWNRFYYYFKELLVEMFFYPAFYRSGWAGPRLRVLVAVFAAAFAGNAYFHLLRDHEPVLAGDWPAVVTYWVPRLIYCLLLSLGIWLSMLRQQELRRRAGPPAGWIVRLRGMAGVWTFFGLLHVWLVEPPVADATRRWSFFQSLAGF